MSMPKKVGVNGKPIKAKQLNKKIKATVGFS